MERTDPKPVNDERAMLSEFLDYQRATLLMKVDGLDAASFRHRIPTSALSLGGLVKHLAGVEDDYFQLKFLDLPELEP